MKIVVAVSHHYSYAFLSITVFNIAYYTYNGQALVDQWGMNCGTVQQVGLILFQKFNECIHSHWSMTKPVGLCHLFDNMGMKNLKKGPVNTALIWQKEASDKSDISRKRAKCVCHLHWRQWNIRMSYLTYLLVGWVFLHEIWRRRRAHYVNYENINNSNLDGMSLASFCQSRAE